MVNNGVNSNTGGNILISRKETIQKILPLKLNLAKEYAAKRDTKRLIIDVIPATKKLFHIFLKKLLLLKRVT